MKITKSNGEFTAVLEKLTSVTKKEIELPSKVGYSIIKNKLTLEQALKPYDLARDEIIKNKSGGKTSISEKENPREFNEIMEAIKEIAVEEISVEIKTIKFDAISERDLPLNVLSALEFMIEEE